MQKHKMTYLRSVFKWKLFEKKVYKMIFVQIWTPSSNEFDYFPNTVNGKNASVSMGFSVSKDKEDGSSVHI